MAEKVDPPSGSPVMVRVVREEIPLSRREGEEIMKRRLSGESRSPSPPPFEPSSSTAIATKTDTETATAATSAEVLDLERQRRQAELDAMTPEQEKERQERQERQEREQAQVEKYRQILEEERRQAEEEDRQKRRQAELDAMTPEQRKRRPAERTRRRAEMWLKIYQRERVRLQSELERCEDEEKKKRLQREVKNNDEQTERYKREIQEATEELERLENEEAERQRKEEESSRRFLKEAMKLGFVHVSLVKVTVVGPAGVGKTCLKYLLLSKSPPSPEDRTSTGCAERAIRVIRVGKEGEKWSEITSKELQEMIAEAVPILYEELKKKGIGMGKLDEVLTTLVGKMGEGEMGEGEMGVGKMGEVNEGGVGEGKRQQEEGVDSGSAPSESESAGSGRAAIDTVIQKLTQLICDGKSSKRLLDMQWIYFTDCGGQQAFWDLIPIFTYDTSATIFVHRLCEKLDERPLNDLYKSGQRVGPSQRATLTTAEAFKTMLRGLQEKGKRSKIVAVGTHKDLANDCEETPEAKNKKLAAIISPHYEEDVLFCGDDLKDVIFQVNTIDPKGDDQKTAGKIRESVEKCATDHEIPIWWFILELILEALAHKLGREVLSKEECIHVSDALGFTEEELDAALKFFDKLNLFLYKKDVLPNVVFTNSQVPLDKLSELVEERYHLKAAEADPKKDTGRARTGDWRRFRDNGTLTLKFLAEFKHHYEEGIFTADDFLTLLKKLLVVAPISATEYFFPAVLDMTPEAQINECLTSTKPTKIAALAIWFPTGWAPPGVYCCSICHLRSHTNWEIVDKTRETRITRNCTRFAIRGRPGSVTFFDNFSFFAIRVNVDTSDMQPEDLSEHCRAIRTQIFAAVEAGLENTHHTNSRPEVAFLCPHQNESCSTELHAANVSVNGKQWICSKNSDVFAYLTPEQTVWLGGPAATSGGLSEPAIDNLANHVAAIIPDKWKQIAIQLRVSMSEIRRISTDEKGSFDRFMAVFDHWKSASTKPYTWKILVDALKSRSVDEVKVADELHRMFCS